MSPPSSPTTTVVLTVCECECELSLGMSCTRDRSVSVLLRLAYFIWHNALRVPPCGGVCQNFLPFRLPLLCCVRALDFVYPLVRWALGLLPLSDLSE